MSKANPITGARYDEDSHQWVQDSAKPAPPVPAVPATPTPPSNPAKE